MRIISRKTLSDFWTRYPDSQEALKAWYKEVEKAVWKNPADIKMLYKSASILKNNRIVFNICGNKYRIIVRCNYNYSMIYIRFIGIHSEYDKIDAENI